MKKLITTTFAGIALFCSASAFSQTSFTVHFDFDRYDLTYKGRLQLDSFLTAEKENLPAFILRLDGHCDDRGSYRYNDGLSEKRALTVKQYLLTRGVESGSFEIIKGHGKNEPLNGNETAVERLLNRRVEITIVKQNGTSPVTASLKEQLADSAASAGTNIILRNINFVGGRHQFLSESKATLEELLNAMNTYPQLIIRIEGHICCLPDSSDGPDNETGIENLSEARAKAVMDYLLASGVEPSRLSYKGFGHSSPIFPYPEKTEEERTANRRVEIKILHR